MIDRWECVEAGAKLTPHPQGRWVAFEDYMRLATVTVHLRLAGPGGFLIVSPSLNTPGKMALLQQWLQRMKIQSARVMIPDAGEVESYMAEVTRVIDALIAAHPDLEINLPKPPWSPK